MSRKGPTRRNAAASRPPSRSNETPPVTSSPPSQPWRQAQEARQQQRLAEGAARRQRVKLARWGKRTAIGVVLIGMIAGVVVWQLAKTGPTGPAGLPGPRGGPSVAQDVNTLVGEPAPSFTLADSEGTSYTVTPGQGRPIVLVSHMGIT